MCANNSYSLSINTVSRCLSGVLVSLLLLFSAQSMSAANKPTGPAATTPKGTKLYTRFSLYYEDLNHRTTNYRKGILVPVNTEVTFVQARKKEIIVALSSGQNLKIENVQEYSGEDIDGIFNRTFSLTKVDLGAFTEEERKAIKAGDVKPGMTKAAVIVALGYPPKHKTPSLESDQWRYWQNRFATFVVNFDNDKVSSIKR